MPQTLGIVASHKNNAWWDTWGAAYERALAGVRQAHILCVGDSLSQGFYTEAPYYTHSWAARIGTDLAVRTGVTPGTGVLPVHEEFEVTDARTSVTGTWSTFTGGFFGVGRSASSSATFTLGPVTCSAFRITFATESDGGAWTATVDAGTPANYTSNGATGISTVEIDAGGSGSHTLTITATNKCYLVAVEAVANPTTGVKVSRVGKGSMETSAFIANADAKSSLRSFRSLTADLVIIEFGLNEAFLGTSTATFEANLATLITEAKGIGASVLVLAAPPPNPSHISEVTWTSFRTSMSTVAAANGAGFVDMASYWTSYAVSTFYYFDNVHPNVQGHYDMAACVADFVVDTVAPSSTSFAPTDISSLGMWLDSNDVSSFTFSSGAVVSQWNDKSGNARHFTQSTVTNQPSRGLPVKGIPTVDFNGTDEYMTAGDVMDLGTASLTVFAVVIPRNYITTRVILSKYKLSPTDGSILFWHGGSSDVQSYYRTGGSLVGALSSSLPRARASIYGFILDRSAGTITQRVDLATNGSNTFTSDTGTNHNIAPAWTLGNLLDAGGVNPSTYWWFGGIGEVIVYQKALNSTEREQVESYLSDKWGIRA